MSSTSLTPLPFATELLVASHAVQSACILTKNIITAALQNTTVSKSDSSPVTLADFVAQALLISFVRRYFPDDEVVGEEDAKALWEDGKLQDRVREILSAHVQRERGEGVGEGEETKKHGGDEGLETPAIESKEEMCNLIDLGGSGSSGRKKRIWMLDPVDGTASFLRGEQYAVALALVVDGDEKVGVLGCPMLRIENRGVGEKIVDLEGFGFMVSAVKNQGAMMRPMVKGDLQPASKIERRDGVVPVLKDLHFADAIGLKSKAVGKYQKVAKRLGAQWPGTILLSSQMRYVALAVGVCDAMVRIPRTKDRRSFVCDHAGGHLIYKETGGMLTDIDGKDLDFGMGRRLEGNWGVVAAPKEVHGEILKVVREEMLLEGCCDNRCYVVTSTLNYIRWAFYQAWHWLRSNTGMRVYK